MDRAAPSGEDLHGSLVRREPRLTFAAAFTGPFCESETETRESPRYPASWPSTPVKSSRSSDPWWTFVSKAIGDLPNIYDALHVKRPDGTMLVLETQADR